MKQYERYYIDGEYLHNEDDVKWYIRNRLIKDCIILTELEAAPVRNPAIRRAYIEAIRELDEKYAYQAYELPRLAEEIMTAKLV